MRFLVATFAGGATTSRRDGSRGHPRCRPARPADREIYAHAKVANLTLITGDVGFANILLYPPGDHTGLVVARYPNELPAAEVNAAVVAALGQLAQSDLGGNLVILEPGRVRVRRRG